MRLISIVLCVFILGSCGIRHNIPNSSNPNKSLPPHTSIAFVDQNGSFYPNDWNKVYGNPPKNGRKNAYSLRKIAEEKSLINNLDAFEESYLKRMSQHLKDKNRVFVLIHGFNARARNVTSDYEKIQQKLNLGKNDEVIQFYWDGLYTKNPFSGMKTWFNAADYSQFAGKFALRKLLNTMSNKHIYLISHSRGAAVVLSALSYDNLDSTKIADVAEHHFVDTLKSNNLILNRKNTIYAIALGPAVGKSDFEIKHEGSDVVENIGFTPQLRAFHITTNENDLMLKKVVGILANKLNPTDLGYKADSYLELSKKYKFLKRTDFSGQKSHDFTDYIRNRHFNEILKLYKLNK